MGGLMSRNKGKRGEREVVKLLQPVVNKVYAEMGCVAPDLERNLMQSHKGGHDVVGLEWLALEVKYQETPQLRVWWEQTHLQALGVGNRPQRTPVLIWRKNNSPWKVRMRGYLPAGERKINCVCDIELPSFLLWLEHRLVAELSLPPMP